MNNNLENKYFIEMEDKKDYLLFKIGDLLLKTDTWRRKGKDSVLGLSGKKKKKTSGLINFILNNQELVKNKKVLEVFAGSGPFGYLSLKLGAQFCDFVDINSRTISYLKENAKLNSFKKSLYSIYNDDIRNFLPKHKYDIIFANPPYVPTPVGIQGPLHSDGGIDGLKLIKILLNKIDLLLKDKGEAFIYTLLLESDTKPVIYDDIKNTISNRSIKMLQQSNNSIDLNVFKIELIKSNFIDIMEINSWYDNLIVKYGSDLTFNWYIIHIKEKTNTSKYSIKSYNNYDNKNLDDVNLEIVKKMIDFEINR